MDAMDLIDQHQRQEEWMGRDEPKRHHQAWLCDEAELRLDAVATFYGDATPPEVRSAVEAVKASLWLLRAIVPGFECSWCDEVFHDEAEAITHDCQADT